MPQLRAKWEWKWVSQSCPILSEPMDYTVHGILQARILEWVAIPFSRGSSRSPQSSPGIELRSPALQANTLPSELPEKPIQPVIQKIVVAVGFPDAVILSDLFSALLIYLFHNNSFHLFANFQNSSFCFMFLYLSILTFFLLVVLLWANNQFEMVNLLLLILYTDQLSFLFLPDYSV